MPNTYNRELMFQVIRGEKKAIFSYEWLIKNGFTYMGSAWGNRGQDYYQIETEIGSICVVDFNEVWIERGSYEHKLEKVKSEKELEQFLSLLA